jgi:hypothetical protein
MSKTHSEGWTVGQEVCVVITLNVRGEPKPRTATITKIGRIWIHLDGGKERFDAETCRIDGRGYSSPGKVYLHEDDYLQSTAAQREWASFYRGLRFSIPHNLTLEDVRKLKAIVTP